jgi:hypothetical protein
MDVLVAANGRAVSGAGGADVDFKKRQSNQQRMPLILTFPDGGRRNLIALQGLKKRKVFAVFGGTVEAPHSLNIRKFPPAKEPPVHRFTGNSLKIKIDTYPH